MVTEIRKQDERWTRRNLYNKCWILDPTKRSTKQKRERERKLSRWRTHTRRSRQRKSCQGTFLDAESSVVQRARLETSIGPALTADWTRGLGKKEKQPWTHRAFQEKNTIKNYRNGPLGGSTDRVRAGKLFKFFSHTLAQSAARLQAHACLASLRTNHHPGCRPAPLALTFRSRRDFGRSAQRPSSISARVQFSPMIGCGRSG